MSRPLCIGIDVSTTGVRAKVVDLDASSLVSEAMLRLPAVEGSGGIREQDADFGALALDAIGRALAGLPADVRVAGVAVTATSGTIVPVDGAGRQAGPAVMYDDGRAAGLERTLQEVSVGRPTATLARIAAVTRADPAVRPATVAQVVGAALVGGPVAADSSHLLKAGIDPAIAAWPSALVEAAGVDPALLPAITSPGAELGEVTCGAAAGAVLVAGMTDGCTSQLAAGAVAEGQTVGVLGTTLVLKAVVPVDRWDAASGLYAHRAPDGAYWLGGASNVGGGSLVLPDGMDFDATEAAARRLGPAPVVRYPLPRRGERFPIADSAFAGVEVGLDGRPATTADPVASYRAALEGVAFVERLGIETLGADPAAGGHLLSGGGTRNELWNELRAACLGAAVRIPEHGDSGFGVAVIAAWRVIGGPFPAIAARFTGGGRTVDPDPSLAAAMAERYEVFRAALAAE